MKKLLIMICAVLSLFQGVTFASGNNLLKNPGFEESDSPYFWTQYIWTTEGNPSEISIVTTGAHSGNNCARIVSNVQNDVRLKQAMEVKPGTVYKISGWIKTENVGTSNKGANFSADMIMQTSADIKGTTDWQYVEVFGRTGANQTSLTITAGLGGYGSLNSGTAYFDDISVEEATDVTNGAEIIDLDSGQTNNTNNSSGSDDKSWLIIVAALLIAAIAVVVFFVVKTPAPSASQVENYSKNKSGSSKKTKDKEDAPVKKPVFKIDRKDLYVMGAMTLVYLVIALFNLGSTNVPDTIWKPTIPGEGFIVKFDREYEISKIGYYNNIGDGKYSVKYRNANGVFSPLGTINQDVFNVLRWNYIDNLSTKTKEIRITVDAVTNSQNGPALSEIVFFEKGSKEPIKGFTVEPFNIDPNDKGTVNNLFDEQDKFSYYNTYMNSSYFDEIYHPRTAYENIHRMEPYETTHPPLGKAIMTIGIFLFGMNPFGWRIMGTLFGAAMIPAMYLLGKKMFYKRIFAFISAFLMMFDCMHFAQTRIGTIDSYPGLFLILTFYFMYDAFTKKSYKIGFKQSLKPLLLAGIFWALGSASKWTAVYAAFSIAIFFITAKVLEYMDYKKATNPRINKGKPPLWTKTFLKKNIFYTLLCCIVFFIVIPVIIYTASYLPIITLPGDSHNLEEVVRYQKNMFSYHGYLTADHPFESKAYQWPMNQKPLLEYRDTTSIPSGHSSLMYVVGNPAIFWFGALCILLTIAIGLWKRDKRAFFIIVTFAVQYVPWLFITRCLFIYHYFTATPFLMLSIVYVLKFMHDDFPKLIGKAYMSKQSELTAFTVSKSVIYGYLAIVFLFFVWLYPAISGFVMDSWYLPTIKWLGLV